jgi:hypothetical protein
MNSMPSQSTQPPAAGEAAHTPTLKTYQRPEWKGWYKLTRTTVVEVYGTPPTTQRDANIILARAETRGNDSFTTHTSGDEHLISSFPKEVRQ